MIPGEPGQTIACGVEPGRAEEVVTLDEDAAVVVAGEGKRDDGVGRLACRPVVLPDREHASAGEIRLEIGIARLAIARRGQRLRRRAVLDPIQALVGEVGGNGHAILHRVGAAPVLVHAGAHIERRRGQVLPAPCGVRRTSTVRPASWGRTSSQSLQPRSRLGWASPTCPAVMAAAVIGEAQVP
jgi:hypothetical protein